MATVIGVGMQMTASAAGMTKGLSEADRALQLLQKIVEQNQQSLAKFGQQATKTSGQLDSLTKNANTLANIEIGRVLIDGAQAIAGVFSSVASQVAGLVSNVNSSIDTLNDLSARTGIGVEQLQKYAFAAKLAGVDTEQFGAAVQKLAVNIGKATPGGELDKSLRQINLSVAELRALAPERQFSVIGEAISQLPTAADRAAASVAIFGKQGAALAPLFREGAASIEELQARAERLGIIISETQVNNVADMNDAFDTVRATIEGIIGQVLGNLAPAVTAVTEEFLRFVEEWSGAQGQGGTGIANAISDVLFDAAEFFAGVFDYFIENTQAFTTAFGKFADAIVGAASTLSNAAANLSNPKSIAKTLINNAPIVAVPRLVYRTFFGKTVETAEEATKVAESEGSETAASYLKGIRKKFEERKLPEFQIKSNLEKTQAELGQFLKTAEDGGSKFLQDSQETLRAFEQQAKAGGLTAEQIKAINDFTVRINAELVKEKGLREEARIEAQRQKDAAEALAKADAARIENLLKASDAQASIANDIAAVEREQARVQQELNAARDASKTQQADQAAARLAQLDQLQASLQDQQQAFEQGFGDGFGKAFEATNKQVNDLINKAAEFGNAGAEAAQQFQQGVARVQQQARDGILNAEAYQQEIQRQRALFEQQLGVIKNEEQEKLAAAKRVDDFLRQGIDARRQAELDAAKQLEERKKQAALNVAEIQKRIEEEEKRNQEARDKGNMRDARDSTTRLRQLRALQREENAIAEGNGRRIGRVLERASNQQNNAFEQFASAATQQIQQFNNAVSDSVLGVNAALEASAESFRKLARQEQASLMLGPQQIAVSDVRTAEGQQMVLDAAAQYQDPVLIQMRQQQKVLQQIAQGLTQNLNRIGVPSVLV